MQSGIKPIRSDGVNAFEAYLQYCNFGYLQKPQFMYLRRMYRYAQLMVYYFLIDLVCMAMSWGELQ